MTRGRRTAIRIPDQVGLAYLAGVLDSDGCIRISSNKVVHAQYPTHFAVVVVTNTNESLMSWLQAEVGGNVHSTTPRNANWKVRYDWRISGVNALDLIEAVLPYLVVKRTQAGVVLKMRQLVSSGNRLTLELVERREQLSQQIGVLNKRGTPVALKAVA